MNWPAWPEIVLEPEARVIADLHLDLGSRASVAPFVEYLRALGATGKPTPELVVLGDLFDVWVGPAQMRMEAAGEVLDALRALTERGTRLTLVHGNRDFLLDQRFERRSGARVFPEGFVATFKHDQRALFVHGDTLCTKDRGYQRLRRVLRSPPLTWAAPRLPLFLSSALARRLRRASVKAIAAKLPDEKSIQSSAVLAAARASQAALVVCGHAHTFRDERLDDVRWIVLDAFGGAQDELTIVTDRGGIDVHSSSR